MSVKPDCHPEASNTGREALTLRPGDGREMNKSEIKDKDKNIDKEKSHENSWQIYK